MGAFLWDLLFVVDGDGGGDGEYFFVVVSSSFDLGVFSFWWVCGYGYLIGRLNKRV